MTQRRKRILQICAVVALLGVLGIATLVAFKDPLITRFALARIESQTGLEGHLGKLHLGMGDGTMHVEDLVLTNSSDFGSSVFLNLAELHASVDVQALGQQQLRLKELRVNLQEIHVVRDKQGRTNVMEIYKHMEEELDLPDLSDESNRTNTLGYEFMGIEKLVLSMGTIRFSDLRDPRQNRTFHMGVSNHVTRNVRTEEEFHAALVLLVLKAGAWNFFNPPVARTNAPSRSVLDMMLGQ